MAKFTHAQIVRTIFKGHHESRDRAKKYLKDIGGTGRAAFDVWRVAEVNLAACDLFFD